jgi:Xaa-Pro aminopeptidase
MVSQHQNQAAGLSVYGERRARLRRTLFEAPRAPDAALITHIANVSYLTGFTGSYAWLVLTPSHAHVITSGIYATQIGIEVPDLPVSVHTPAEEAGAVLADLLHQWGVHRLASRAATPSPF